MQNESISVNLKRALFTERGLMFANVAISSVMSGRSAWASTRWTDSWLIVTCSHP